MLGSSRIPGPLSKRGSKSPSSLAKAKPVSGGSRGSGGKHPGRLAKGLPGVHKVGKSPYSC